jgi:hypothetical protein
MFIPFDVLLADSLEVALGVIYLTGGEVTWVSFIRANSPEMSPAFSNI